MGTENWGDVESIIQSLAAYGYEPLPKDDVVSRYQWLKKISEVTESEKIAFMKEHSTTVLWDASGRAIHALARLADVFFNEASTLREQIAREIMKNFDGGHTKGENDCSCQEDSDPCYFCGAKDYTGIAAAIARGEK